MCQTSGSISLVSRLLRPKKSETTLRPYSLRLRRVWPVLQARSAHCHLSALVLVLEEEAEVVDDMLLMADMFAS